MENGTETRTMETLLDKGVIFKIPTHGPLSYFRPNHIFRLRQAHLGTLLLLTKYYLQTGLDEDKLAENPLVEARLVVNRSTQAMARIAAIGILNSKWRIRLFTRPLANFLLWRLTPKTLYELCMTIVMLNNTGDFINSIRLTQGLSLTKEKAKRSPVDNGG